MSYFKNEPDVNQLSISSKAGQAENLGNGPKIKINQKLIAEDFDKLSNVIRKMEMEIINDLGAPVTLTNKPQIREVLDKKGYFSYRQKMGESNYVVDVLKVMERDNIEIAKKLLGYNKLVYQLNKIKDLLGRGDIVQPTITTSITKRVAYSNPSLSNTSKDILVRYLDYPNLYEIDMSQADPKCVFVLLKLKHLRKEVMEGQDFYNLLIKYSGQAISRDNVKTIWNASVYGSSVKELMKLDPRAGDMYKYINSMYPEIAKFRTKIQDRMKKGSKYFSTIEGVIEYTGNLYMNQIVNYSMQTSSSEVFNMIITKLKSNGIEPIMTIYDSALITSDLPQAQLEKINAGLTVVIDGIPFNTKLTKLK